MRFTTATLLGLFLVANTGHAQTPQALCDISGTTVRPTVAYDAARGVYVYSYTVTAPATNTGRIAEFWVETTAGSPQPASDAALSNDACRIEARPNVNYRRTPQNAVTVGLSGPGADWSCGTSRVSTTSIPNAQGQLVSTPSGARVGWISEGNGIIPARAFPGFGSNPGRRRLCGTSISCLTLGIA